MIELTGDQVAEFFRRSYTAVDGLWFMKVEERFGFEAALEIDDEVWKVFPKLQARKLKELAGLGDGIEALREALTTKLALEGYEQTVEKTDGGFCVTIRRCPWLDVMARSGREGLSAQVGSAICSTEFAVWASEFGKDIEVEQEHRICEGEESCAVYFTH